LKLALDDVKVIEYGSLISAPYCSKLLADMGADVIKIEKPGQGDTARNRGPFLNDIPGRERSGLFLYLNTNKRGITLNLEKATGQEIFKKLVKEADILIEDTKPGKLLTLGLGYHNLESINPKLIMTSVTPFGQTGPYKNYKGSDLIGWHMGGAGYVTPRFVGTTEQEPLRAMQTASFITGITAAVATMCALHVQRHTSLGQQVDVSQLEAVVLLGGPIPAYWPYEHRSRTRASRFALAPIAFLKCKDGWICINAVEEHHWRRFVNIMGNPEWADEELFKDTYSRGEYWESLEPLITDWTMKHTIAEILEAGGKELPIGPVKSVAEIMESRQLKERGFFIEVEHPKAGKLTYPGAPYRFSRTPWIIRRPAPLLGQHNEDVYCNQLGYTKKELVKMYEAGII